VGFGLGIMAYKDGIMTPAHFEVATVFALVAGGFLLAMGLPGKKFNKERMQASSNQFLLKLNKK